MILNVNVFLGNFWEDRFIVWLYSSLRAGPSSTEEFSIYRYFRCSQHFSDCYGYQHWNFADCQLAEISSFNTQKQLVRTSQHLISMKFTFLSLHLGVTLISLEIRGFDAARSELTSFTAQLRGRVLQQNVQIVGNNGSPTSAFPLMACQGDCDVDDDCAGMLECFQRDGGEAVPGCGGGELDSSRTDYCFDPAGGPTPVTPTASPAAQPTDTPVAQPTVTQPTAGPPVTIVGNNGSPTSAFPLMACQGDCDVDDDCAGMLECFQRDGGEAVPGCGGGELDSSRTDYCFDPAGGPTPVTPTASPAAQPTDTPVAQPTVTQPTAGPPVTIVGNNGSPTSAFPLMACQGDCDVDDDCAGMLECFQRDGGEAVPGCGGGELDSSRTDYCFDPAGGPTPVTPTASPAAQPTDTPVADPSPTPVANPSPTPVANPSPTPVANPSPTPVANPSPTPVADPSLTPVANPSPTPVANLSPSPESDASPSPVGTAVSGRETINIDP
jgi:hypothetical protein